MGGIRHGYWLCFALFGAALVGCSVKVSTNNGAGGASGASGSGAGTSQGGSSSAGTGGTSAGTGGTTAGSGGTTAGAAGTAAGAAGAAGKGGAGAGGTAGSGGSTAGAAGAAGTSGAGGAAMASNKGLSGFPASCSAAPADDACMSCVRTSCCTQIQACNDGSCHDAYASFLGCRFDATGAETGFSTNYCVNDTKLASTPAAKALEQCFVDKCMATACAKPEEKTTWSTFADEFVEQFCVGCHFPNDKGLPPKASASSSFPVGPTGQKLTIFNSDVTWGNWGFKTPCSFGDCGFNPPTDAMPPKGDMPEPAANPDWPSMVDPDGIAKKKEVIVCGVHPTKLMPGCENIKDDVLPANFFHMKGTMDTGAPVLKKFPPKGDGTDHFGSPNPCWWADDASPPLTQGKPTKGTCVQPTDHDRARFVSWILDGMAKLAATRQSEHGSPSRAPSGRAAGAGGS